MKNKIDLKEEIHRLESELKKMTSDYVSLAKQCNALLNDIKFLKSLLNSREREMFEVERLINRAGEVWKLLILY